MKRGELPVFTSMSAIPFGVNQNLVGMGGQRINGDGIDVKDVKSGENQADVDIWEVPETPRK
jgi:hypothetical protein